MTIRDSEDVWYKSLINFHSKSFGDGLTPVKQDLIKAKYVHKGWIWEMNRIIYNTPEDNVYNEIIIKKQY